MSRSRTARAHHRFNDIPGLGGNANSNQPTFNNYSQPQGFNGYNSQSASTIEHDNEQEVGYLGSQISELKNISLMIGDEVSYQRNLLSEMERDFDHSDDLLAKTMKRLKIMASKQSGLWVWLLLLFWMLVCMYIYFFRY